MPTVITTIHKALCSTEQAAKRAAEYSAKHAASPAANSATLHGAYVTAKSQADCATKCSAYLPTDIATKQTPHHTACGHSDWAA